MRPDFITVINTHNMVSEDVMPGRSVERYQRRFRRKRYFYLQRTSFVPNTLFHRHRLGPRTKFHTNRKQLTYHPWTHFDTSCIQTQGTRQTRL